jgi:parallel beta-helix repeat protein
MAKSLRLTWVTAAIITGAVCALSGCTGGGAASSLHVTGGTTASPGKGAEADNAPSHGTAVCGQQVLQSPWTYDGAAGTFTASNAPSGLPTFGSAGTDFPSATQLVVVPAGNNTSPASSGAYGISNTVIYFEPGEHQVENGMNTGHDSAYVGGYTQAAGKAVVDGVDGATNGTGTGGSSATLSTPSSGNNVYDTYEYLTIENFSSTNNNSVLGNTTAGPPDVGDTYKYDTIGPNEYGYVSSSAAPATGESNGGGYAIDAGSYTTIEYDCLTHNAQGAFNVLNAVNLNISHNEISWNGLGTYPDDSGPGGSPFGCGCSGGGKIFYSMNADFVGNYVHDNYNAGVWFDFDNAGALITDNYIASNWAQGIMYEASYNARIADNTLTGNGWASDGPWPAGLHDKDCYGNVPCSEGYGPITGAGGGNPYGAIDTSNSGGNPNLKSRYAGSFLIADNDLTNNFGGVKVYTDTNRYPDNIDQDSACGVPLGPLDQNNSSLYYKQGKVLVTNGDASISGSTVSTSGGTQTICGGYGSSADNGAASTVQAPSVGMAVYDQNSGDFLGTVASVSSAHSFTLSDTPASETGATLLLSAYGGCGPADYYGGKPGVATGDPKAMYWDNCVWGSRNITVTGNLFSTDASTVTGCETAANLCGYMMAAAFNAGVPKLMGFFDAYQTYIANATGGLGNAWSDNTYQWSGSGGWQFVAGAQGNVVSRAAWRAAPYHQDAGSTFK